MNWYTVGCFCVPNDDEYYNKSKSSKKDERHENRSSVRSLNRDKSSNEYKRSHGKRQYENQNANYDQKSSRSDEKSQKVGGESSRSRKSGSVRTISDKKGKNMVVEPHKQKHFSTHVDKNEVLFNRINDILKPIMEKMTIVTESCDRISREKNRLMKINQNFMKHMD